MFAALALVLPSECLSAELPEKIFKEGEPVEITADYLTYDKETNTYFARGNVVITQGKSVVMTDAAMADLTTGIATAKGNIRGTDEAGDTFGGETLHMDIKEQTLVLAKGRLFFKKEHVYLTGDPMRKTGESTYEAEKALYTPCDCKEDENPAWSFYSRTAKVTLGEYITGWHAFFQIKGVPVLYTPYFSVPIKDERQSGFLTPKPGYSKMKGFILENSFFWDISKSQDATFFLDTQSVRGLGKGVEYRYIRTRKSQGEFSFYHFKEKDIERVRRFRKGAANRARPITANDDRWQLKYQHTENLPKGFNVKADINVVSDDEYFLDFGETGKERSLESIESNISVSKSWSHYSFVTQFRHFDNLLIKDKSPTLQRIPEMTFRGSDQRIYSSPFYLSMDSSLINFYRDEGVKGQRLDMQPRISLPLNPGGYFDFTPSIGPRGTWYLVKRDPNGRYTERYIYDVRADATTTFVRVYGAGFGEMKALRHTIRPKVVYSYIPEAIQTDQPVFDSVDHLPPTSSFTYSLNNILTGKFYDKNGAKSYLDIFYLDVSQTYDVNEATKKLEGDGVKRRPFSDVTLEAIIKPNDWLKITGKEKYDVNNRWPTSYDMSLDAHDARGDSLSVSERFLRAKTRYVEGNVRIRVIRPLDFTYAKRYSIDQKKSLESIFGLEYKHQCYSITLTYTIRPEDKIVFVTFNLMGLGKVAALQGNIL